MALIEIRKHEGGRNPYPSSCFLLPASLLALLYWLVRLHNLTALPGFFDEAVHIRWAKLAWSLQPFHAASDGRLLNIWAYALFYPFGNALWVSRAAGVLAGALGFAALTACGQLLFSRRAGGIAGAIYVVIPYAMFYERMALVDPFSAPLVSLTLWAACVVFAPGEVAPRSADAPQGRSYGRPTGRGRLTVAGTALAALLLTKLTNLLFLPMPLLAALLLSKAGRRAQALISAGAIYVVMTLLVGGVVAAAKVIGRSDLGFDLIQARTWPAPLSTRIATNAGSLAEFARLYLGWPVIILILGGAAGIVLRRNRNGLLPLGVATPPLIALLAGSNIVESRFVVPVLPLLALMCGWAVDEGGRRLPLRWRGPIAVVGFAGLLLSGPAEFMWQAWQSPGELRLTAWDRYQYVEEWPAGFGLRETAEIVFRQTPRPLEVVVSDEGHIPQLSLYSPDERRAASLYGYDVAGVRLLHLPPDNRDPFVLADPARAALYVVETPRNQAARDSLLADKTLIARFERPGGKSAIEVYHLEPAP